MTMGAAADKQERKRLREVSRCQLRCYGQVPFTFHTCTDNCALFRYYCATKFPVDNTFNGNIGAGTACDGGLDPFPASDNPLRPARHSPDPALTVFAQLAVHRLNCQRAFISIIDHKTHHVIAEATKTISLQFEDQHAEGDMLYCGLQALPVQWGICPSTIHVFSDPNSEYAISTSNITANTTCYIIRDLSIEEAYMHRPYVQGWPFMRFYAEVPVKSPAGFVIGSFAIVDDKPRQIFTDADVAILQEISTVITQHLETVRLQHDSKHAGRLMQGLSSFIKEESSAKGLEEAASAASCLVETSSSKLRRLAKPPHAYRSELGPDTVFSRASSLIRKSMDLEGVVFFDARRSISTSHSKQSFCENLGFSTRPDSIMGEALGMPQDLLQQISARYSTGQIFNFDELGLVAADQDEGSSNTTPTRNSPETDAALLAATFPGAHSIIFFPLPGAGDRWYAGCFGWTFDAKRALQTEEITYFAAFSNSIMSEIFRLEAVAMDRAKSDFISSISHELRSPLHGILATAELLEACSSGSDQDSLIHMVDTCGRTLLDTMNHLFDYAKITNTSRWGSSTSNSDSSSPMSTRSTLDLSELVEEVVEAVYTGHKFSRSSSITSPNVNGARYAHQPVKVILDIASASDWVFKSEAGAWRRIVMNLFGNALKYTETGAIRVSLHADRSQTHADVPSSTMVKFSVTDTGKGISQDYLKNRLYTPFAQEDSLSVGTGLGLSIVRQIVTALGGSMKIQSEYGEGTSVTVLIPLEASLSPADAPEVDTRKITQDLRSRKITYVLLSCDTLPDNSNEPSMRSVLQALSDWFGLERIHLSSAVLPDLVIAEAQAIQHLSNHDEADFSHHEHRIDANSCPAEVLLHNTAPVLILGTSSSVQHLPRSNRQRRLSQPFGPHKLATAIYDSLSLNDVLPAALETNGGAPKRASLKRSYSTMSTTMSPSRLLGSQLPPIQMQCMPESRGTADIVAASSMPSLLLVDDNEINLKIIATYIQKLPCRFKTASNGLEAVERYQEAYEEGTPFDVVLMDVSMPVMDGFEATREIRAFERQKGAERPSRIIALTGLTSGKSQEEALASGVNLFLTKPVQLKKLKGVLGLARVHKELVPESFITPSLDPLT
jgi:signal transduction histidine kinase/CheY-like chemotaxis protein